jgi:hypothetical protein
MSGAIKFTGQEGNDPTEAITQDALNMMREAGVYVGELDPEAKTIDFSSPYKFLKSMEAAITAKQSRVGSQPGQPGGQVSQVGRSTNQPGRSTSQVAPTLPTSLGASGSPTWSAESLITRLVELQKDPGKNMAEIMKIGAQLDDMLGTGT